MLPCIDRERKREQKSVQIKQEGLLLFLLSCIYITQFQKYSKVLSCNHKTPGYTNAINKYDGGKRNNKKNYLLFHGGRNFDILLTL